MMSCKHCSSAWWDLKEEMEGRESETGSGTANQGVIAWSQPAGQVVGPV